MITQKMVNEISYNIVNCAIEVNKELGPGLLEKIYEICLIDEMKNRGLDVKSQVLLPIRFKNNTLDAGLKIDILVNDLVIVELKAVDAIIPIYKAQLLTYLKLSCKPKGLLINFNTTNITQQLVPLVTEIFSNLPKE